MRIPFLFHRPAEVMAVYAHTVAMGAGSGSEALQPLNASEFQAIVLDLSQIVKPAAGGKGCNAAVTHGGGQLMDGLSAAVTGNENTGRSGHAVLAGIGIASAVKGNVLCKNAVVGSVTHCNKKT